MIVFRSDAGSDVGMGHLVRCRALASVLQQKGIQCMMVGPSQSHILKDGCEPFTEWFSVSDWNSPVSDAERLIAFAIEYGTCVLVLDDYRIDEIYQRRLRDEGMHWLQFFDESFSSLWGEIIVDASPASHAALIHKRLANSKAQLLLGPQYALLRPEFPHAQASPEECSVRRVFVSFGGGDDQGALLFVLHNLVPKFSESIHFVVMAGEQNPRIKALDKWVKQHSNGRVAVHIQPSNVALLMAECNLAVISGGMMTFEAAISGLPMLILTTATNQVSQAQAWQTYGTADYLGEWQSVSSDALLEAFAEILDDRSRRAAMARRCRKLVDGQGADRIAKSLCSLAKLSR